MRINRALIVINAAGVLALGGLSVAQWRTNARLNLEVIALERAGREQAAKLAESAANLQTENAVRETLRGQVVELNENLRTNRLQRLETERQLKLLSSERDDLRNGLEQWRAAVAERDARLAEANQRIQRLAEERNELVLKHNALVSNFNEAVTRIKALSAGTNGAVGGGAKEKQER